MGIKFVHIAFIMIASLFSLGVSGWVFVRGGAPMWIAFTSGAVGVVLIVYGFYFARKARRLT